jgi:D-beta-D-heptose 7-phosphate kinase/D-beta-D-heptose 1-phosphate adenosyltransferase
VIKDKIKSWEEAAFLTEELRAQRARIVFTNGCFDLLHSGHTQYLEQAKALGDILIVGLNSDASVSLLKGESRPFVAQTDRALVLAALECVDMVVIFSQPTPLQLIELLRPDVLVKGGDWKPEAIVGADIVLAGGGKVLSLPFKEGYSTSSLIRRIAATEVHE